MAYLFASLALLATSLVAASKEPCECQSEVDVLIIGGGVSGFVLADRLSAGAPHKSFRLLEAGPDPTGNTNVSIPGNVAKLTAQSPHGTPFTWNYTSTPQESLGGLAPYLWQGHTYGGGSSVNYMQYCRGAPSVFDEWAQLSGDSGWEWDEFFQYFVKSTSVTLSNETYAPYVNLSAYGNGPVNLSYEKQEDGFAAHWLKAINETGLDEIDLNDGSAIGWAYTIHTILQPNAIRDSSFVAYGSQLANRTNVHIQADSLVTKINFSGKTAVSATYESLNGTNSTICAKHIILAGGAINSPKLLLVSGVGPETELKPLGIPVVANVPELGLNLYDHHWGVVELNVTQSIKTNSALTNATYLAEILNEYHEDANGPLSTPGPGSAALVRIPDGYLIANNATYQLNLPADRPHILYQCSTSQLVQKTYTNANIISCIIALVAPEAAGTVKINSTSIHSNPLIDSAYFGSAGDKASIIWAYQHLRQLFSNNSDTIFAGVIENELFPGSNVTSDADVYAAIQQSASDYYHPVGTLSLGKVLNNDFKIMVGNVTASGHKGEGWEKKGHGKGGPQEVLEGLRVIDSSIMPVIPSCFTQSHTYAIAERGAEILLKELNGS